MKAEITAKVSSYSLYDLDSHDLIQLLCDLGLTPIQSRIYLKLRSAGPLSARAIVESLRLHSADVYRALQHLQTTGVIETFIGNPNKYVAVSPKSVVKQLLDVAAKDYANLRAKADHLRRGLEAYGTNSAEGPAFAPEEGFYRLKSGSSVIRGILSSIQRATKEVRKIAPTSSLNYHLLYGMMDIEQAVIRKGIKIRLITDTQTAPLKTYHRLVNTKYIGRQLGGMLKYVIVDNQRTFMKLASNVTSSRESECLLTNNTTLTNSLINHFDELWKSLEEKVR